VNDAARTVRSLLFSSSVSTLVRYSLVVIYSLMNQINFIIFITTINTGYTNVALNLIPKEYGFGLFIVMC
jgi:hypothetical protein